MARSSLRAGVAGFILALALGGCASDGGGHGPVGHRPGDHGPGSASPQRERVFLSPMGEPFRSPAGEGDPERAWFNGADANRDGRITLAEFQADAARFFATLDVGHDGEIDPADIDRYENVVAPEVRSGGGGGGGGGGSSGGTARGGGGGGGRHGGGGGMGRGGGGMGGGGRHGGGGGSSDGSGSSSAPQATEPSRLGAGRYSYLDIPEPVVAADANMNRGIDANEFANAAAARFKLLDTNGDGVLTWDALPHVHGRANGMRRAGGGGMSRPGGGGFGGGQPGGFGGRPPQDQ